MAFQLIREMVGNLGSSFFQVLIAFARSRRDHVLCAISRNLLERLRKLKHLFVTLVHNGSGVFLQLVLSLKQSCVRVTFQLVRDLPVNCQRFFLENGLRCHQFLKVRSRFFHHRRNLLSQPQYEALRCFGA